MFGYYYGFDSTYLVLVLPCVLFAFWAQWRVNATFERYSRVAAHRGLTAAQAADAVLRARGIYDVRIEYVAGKLTDHYDSKMNVIRLSSGVYSSNSVASVGIACHEAGHAMQYAEGYGPIRLRAAIIPLTNVGAMLSTPFILAGLFLNFSGLVTIGILAFGLSTLFQLLTLPVELDASHRALAALESGHILNGEELSMARKTLWAAAMTYVAALAVSLAQFLRLIILFGGRRRD